MIQRVQTLYLFLAGVLIGALYLFPILHTVYAGVIPQDIRVTGVYQDAGGRQMHTQVFVALTAVTGIIALFPVALIFLFRNRKQQVALCYSALLVIIGYCFWAGETVEHVIQGAHLRTFNYGIGIILPVLSIVLVILAIRAIKADEKLVRSADRLR